jgi:glyoxylase-like metal-dependent hydrolase (beta-lactamase superfamily II)
VDSSFFYYLTEPHQELTIHYRLWVVKGRDSTIVVDSGLPPDEAVRRGITDAKDVEVALREVGVEIDSVRMVVLTHLHWDHASNAERFSRATFVAQRDELDWLTSPFLRENTIGRFYSDVDKFLKMAEGGRFRLLDGDETIVQGIEALKVGGHTPGSQMLLVDGRNGQSILSGDAIPMNRNYVEHIPTGLHLNLLQSIDALERVKQIAPQTLFTGHDPEAALNLT